jgi:exonuclease III
MFQKTILVDDNRNVTVDYFNFTLSSKKEIETYQTFLIAQLYYLAALSKSPFFYSLDLTNRNNLPWKYSSVNSSLGYLGAVATLPSWAAGVALEQVGIWLEEKPVHYYQSPDFTPPDKKQGPLNHGTRNVALLPPFVSNDSRLDVAENRLPGLIQSFRDVAKDVQVLCLQEVFCYSREIIEGVNDVYGYVLHNIAPESLFLKSSGLMILSQIPILEGKFFRPPLPLITPVQDENDDSEIFAEGVANKGFVIALLENHDLVINAHLPSNASRNPKRQAIIEQLRKDAMQINLKEMHEYIAELKQRGIEVRRVMFGGDTNASNEEETGQITLQRTRNAFFFNHFPNKPQSTWLGGYSNYHKHPKVTFDHVGLCPISDPDEMKNYDKQVTVLEEPLHKKGPLSDHALLYVRYIEKKHEGKNSSPTNRAKEGPIEVTKLDKFILT